MTKAFLRSAADYIFENHKYNVEKLCIVMPNKRGAIFLRKHLSAAFSKTIWLPDIISAEDLVAELSGLQAAEETDLICHLYQSYQSCYGSGAEDFDQFIKWGQLILHDFDEIDRHLADPEMIYENLKDIKEIENWSLGREALTPYQQSYLRFMNSLGPVYRHFTKLLTGKSIAYTGLSYRVAVDKLQSNAFEHRYEKIIFCGFNALNAAEEKIMAGFEKRGKAVMLWDADRYYLNDEDQEAGMYLRRNFKRFVNREPLFIGENFRNHKKINVIAVPGDIGQAQVVRQELSRQTTVPMSDTALVLASERLLWPVLQLLPETAGVMNITMEYPLKFTPVYALAEQLLQVQVNYSKQSKAKSVFYKDLIALLRNGLFNRYLKLMNSAAGVHEIISSLVRSNISVVPEKLLKKLFGKSIATVEKLLLPAESTVSFCSELIAVIKTLIGGGDSGVHRPAEQEYLAVLLRHFNRMSDLLNTYPYFKSMHALRQLFVQVVGGTGVPFVGEPLEGLQVMGMLETRTLDFDRVILVTANEGVLPAGKNNASFLPHDLRKAFGLPSHTEKDAVYAYHFYRLLQRAREVTIIYNSESDKLGKGERSRYITQLLMELKAYNPATEINELVAGHGDYDIGGAGRIVVPKEEPIIRKIREKTLGREEFQGLSPSSLIMFKDCSLKFYFRYGAGLKETEEVEESADAGTFGSILHRSLENLYSPLVGEAINKDNLQGLLTKIPPMVNAAFRDHFGEYSGTGKVMLQEEVIRVYVRKLISSDITLAGKSEKTGHILKVSALEKEFTAPFKILTGGQEETAFVRGKIDRIDQFEGTVRIIDYKSSVRVTDKFRFRDFDSLFGDPDYNKQLQLLIYAWLLYKNEFAPAETIRPCVIPFRTFREEPYFITGEGDSPLILTRDFFKGFEERLAAFVENIFDPREQFVQTTDVSVCGFCAYNNICLRAE